jgi:shikimate kinase
LYDIRTPIYALAELTVTSHQDYSIEEMAEKVISALKTRPDILET